VVGAVLGPVSAGLYNIAVQFAAVLDRPVEMLRRSIYPELARLGAAADGDAIRRLTVRSALLVRACALPLVIVLIVVAEPALRLTVGDAYVGAAVVAAVTTALNGIVVARVLRGIGVRVKRL
jgi:O-antigen/teichoic acid export membrane protein